MATKRITDVDFLGSLKGDESFFINQNNSIKQINKSKIVFDITNGGTGANNAPDARTNLGLGSVSTENIVPISKGGTGANTATAALANLGAQAQHIAATVIIPVSGWSDLAQTVSVEYVTSNNMVIVAPVSANHEAYCKAGVYCSAQAENALTFNCLKIPTEDLTVNVIIFN